MGGGRVGCTDTAGRGGLSWRRQDSERLSTLPRPREHVMEKRKLVWRRGDVSKRKGSGPMWLSEGADPSSHVENRRDSDHTTIYPPDCLGLPPSALVTKIHGHYPHLHTQTCLCPSPTLQGPREGGQGLAPAPHPKSFLLVSPLFTPSPRGYSQRTQQVLGEKLRPLLQASGDHLFINPLRAISSPAPSACHLPAGRLARTDCPASCSASGPHPPTWIPDPTTPIHPFQ